MLLAERAAKREWSYRELGEAIRLDRLKTKKSGVLQKEPASSSAKFSVTRAKPYSYKLLEPEYIHPTDENVVVDVGFYINTQVALKGIARPKDGQIVEATKTNSGYTFKPSDAKPK